MSETLSVSVSGAVFSLLLYENIKSEHDQEGFLLGNIITKETKKLTDADHRVIHRENTIKVKSLIPCPHLFYFYNSAGKINTEKLSTFLNGHHKEIIGWYVFKRKRTLFSRLTFREKIIHKQLAEFFEAPLSYFSCCLLTSDSFNVKATYSFRQTFIRYNKTKYESLPLHIVNLSDPCYTFHSADPSSVVNNLIKSVRNSGETEGHLIVKELQDGLQSHMKDLIKEAVESEQQLFKLEQEVKQLKQNLNWKREYQVDGSDTCDVEISENGIENKEGTIVGDSSPETSKKRRGRPAKGSGTGSVQRVTRNNATALENEAPKISTRATRRKADINYSELSNKS